MIKNVMTLVAATIAMIGCASPYVTPASGPTATLILPVSTQKWDPSNNFNHGVRIATKNSNGCGELPKAINPDTFEKDLTVTIAADRDILFSVWRSWGSVFCSNIFSQFHANKDHEYMLNLDMAGRYCVVSIIDKNPNGTITTIKPTRAYVSKIGGNAICDSKDKITGYAM